MRRSNETLKKYEAMGEWIDQVANAFSSLVA